MNAGLRPAPTYHTLIGLHNFLESGHVSGLGCRTKLPQPTARLSDGPWAAHRGLFAVEYGRSSGLVSFECMVLTSMASGPRVYWALSTWPMEVWRHLPLLGWRAPYILHYANRQPELASGLKQVVVGGGSCWCGSVCVYVVGVLFGVCFMLLLNWCMLWCLCLCVNGVL